MMSTKSGRAKALAEARASDPNQEDALRIPTLQPTILSSQMALHTLLVASIGNPAPYTNTFHSAGHVLLTALASYLDYPPLRRGNGLGGGLTSHGKDTILWQSPRLMNDSGSAVSGTWRLFKRRLDPELRTMARLVIVHDELELPLGKIKLSKGGSAKGHRGLKSCIAHLGGLEFWKLGVGIGRPISRESGNVAEFVLRRMTTEECAKITNNAEEASILLGKLAYVD